MPFGFSIWIVSHDALKQICTPFDKASYPAGMRSMTISGGGYHVSTEEGSLAEMALILIGAKQIA